MARKKRTIIEEEAEDPRADDRVSGFDLSKEEEDELVAQEKMQELLSDFQHRFSDQPAKILVEKYDSEGDWALCKKYPLAGFEQDHVKAEFGGGKYRGILFDEHGKYVKGGRINFKFAESLIKEPVEKRPENPLENPIVAMMIKSMESNQTMLLQLTQSMITASSANAPKSGGLAEIVEVVKSLNSMTAKEKPLDNFKETLGLVKLLKEATGSGDEEKGGLLSEIREFLEVAPLLKEQLAQIKPPAGPLGPNPQQGVVTTVNTERKPTMDPLTKKVIELVPQFVGGARANAPIAEWGEFLLDKFDTEILPLLLPIMKEKYKALVKDEDDCYDIILRYAKDPEERASALKQIAPLAPYGPWVNQVIDEAIRIAETPESPEPSGATVVLDAIAPNGSEPANAG